MRCAWLAGTVSLAVGAAMAGGHGAETSWFDENYSGYSAVSGVKWTTAAGTWTNEDASGLRASGSIAEGTVSHAIDASGKTVARNLALLFRSPSGNVMLVR